MKLKKLQTNNIVKINIWLTIFFFPYRFDVHDCEVEDSEGEDDEVNGNENENVDEDSEEGILNNLKKFNESELKFLFSLIHNF